MKRTDKEITEAMTFIKEQHNGEIPYEFGYFECAKMMAKYLKNQLTIPAVSKCNEKVKCGNCDEMVVMFSLGEACPSCYC